MALTTNWYVYILQCHDSSLYTGITTDLERRVQEHNQAKAGAKYTKARRPVALVYSEQSESRSSASKREAQLKKMSRIQKLELVTSQIGG